MKYISRFAALLMMLLLLTGRACALTLDSLTEEQLAGLYQAAAASASVTEVTGVLGDQVTLSVENGDMLSGYTFQWYVITEEGQAAIEGATGYEYDTAYPLAETQYQCIFMDSTGNAMQTNVFALSAQTDDLDAYIDVLYTDYDELYWVPCDPLDAYIEAAYAWMQVWNVTLSDGTNLAENVLACWQEDPDPEELLCTCAGEDADFCINGPDAEHSRTCGWYTGSPVLKLEADTDEDGNPVYTLYATVNAEDVVLAVSEMLDGQHHYFRDAREGELGLYVAWLYIDEDGTPWLMPLASEREATAE